MKKDTKVLIMVYVVYFTILGGAFYVLHNSIRAQELLEEIEYLNRDIINLRDDNWNLHSQLNNTKKPS